MIQEQIVEFLRRECGLAADPGAAVALFSSGLLDSVHILRLVMFIEERFDIRVDVMEVGVEQFDSLDSIVAYIDRSLGRAG
jgi:acyl carrier protein